MHRPRTALLAGLALTVALSVTGCGGSTTGSAGGANTSGSHSPTTPATSPAPSAPARTLQNFGATKQAWLGTHKQAPGFIKGSAFLPMVTAAGEQHPKYAAVQLGTPLVSYTINLPGHTSYSAALSEVLAEFSTDARITKTTRPDPTCKLAQVVSPTVSKAVAKHGYTNKWKFVVEFESHGGATAYDPTAVSDLLLQAIPPGMGLHSC